MSCRKSFSKLRFLPLLANDELFQGNDPAAGSCRHIEFDISNANVSYEAGDHLAVYPSNAAALVERLGKRLHLPLDKYISVESSGPSDPDHLPGE